MEKYMRPSVLTLGLVIVSVLLTIITHNKFAQLQAVQSARPHEFVSLKDRERQLHCMTQNIYYEAASEPAEGKIAVGQIVMNRLENGRFGNDVCGVIYQKNIIMEKVVCQFSWFCESGTRTRPVNQARWDESYEAAKMVLMEGFRLPSLKDALYYHADYVNPNWGKPKVAQIGRHIFYKPRDGKNI